MNEEQLINRLTTLANSNEVIADNIKVDKNIFKETIKLIDKLQKELKLKNKVIDNLYADIEYEYSGTNYLKSLEEYYKEVI